MAVTDDDILRDEQERSNLLRTIASVESAMTNSTPGTRRVLENTIENAKKRIVTLEKKIEESKVERATEVQAQIAAAAVLAAKETKLSASERETYRGLLEEAYFKKDDLGRLDGFYRHSYDRLSEGGKEEMSKRIHEGIRHGEFKFNDLPTFVQKREAEHDTAKERKSASMQSKNSTREDAVSPQEINTKVSTNKETDLGSISLNSVKLTNDDCTPNASSIPNVSNAKSSQHTI